MAILDQERGVVVVRIVYDGPPFSGKTTSVQILAQILGKTAKVFSPKDSSGKTFCFDWVEYAGGYFKGNSILCQIVSIPGQLSLQERRFFLRSADAVVFVMDASESANSVVISYFEEMQSILLQNAEGAISAVIQANKQDKPEAVAATVLKSLFANYPAIQIIESTATMGEGIRETFVSAVRLAIEHAGYLLEQGKLRHGKPEITTAEELLASLQEQVFEEDSSTFTEAFTEIALEEATLEHPAPAKQLIASQQVQSSKKRKISKRLPQFPDEETPRQWIWPPVAGRNLLLKLLQQPLKPHLKNESMWFIDVGNQWRCFSKLQWQYDAMEPARHAFRTHIEMHLQCSPILSETRAIAIAQETGGNWRLWQMAPNESTLAQQLITLFQQPQLQIFALEIFKNALQYVDAYHQCTHYPVLLDLSLDNLSIANNQLIYLGSIDKSPSEVAYSVLHSDNTVLEMLKYAFAIPIRENSRTIDIEKVISELEKIETEHEMIIETLTDLFIEAA